MSVSFQYLTDADVVNLLAFVGGFYDTANYVLLSGIFTSSITGNLVVACASLNGHNNGYICRTFVMVSFVLTSFIATNICLNLRNIQKLNPRIVSLILFTLECVLMIVAWLTGLYLHIIPKQPDLDDPRIVLVGSIMGACMGFHNVAAKETIPNVPATTVMTSTLVNFGSNAANTVCYWFLTQFYKAKQYSIVDGQTNSPVNEIAVNLKASTDKLYESFDKFLSQGKPLISFTIGAILGGLSADHISFYSNSITTGIIAIVMFNIFMKEVKVRALNNIPVDSAVTNHEVTSL